MNQGFKKGWQDGGVKDEQVEEPVKWVPCPLNRKWLNETYGARVPAKSIFGDGRLYPEKAFGIYSQQNLDTGFLGQAEAGK